MEEHEHTQSTKAIRKQEIEVYNRWRKLILGTLIEARLDRDYGKGTPSSSTATTTTTVSSAIPEIKSKTETTTDRQDVSQREPLFKSQRNQEGRPDIGDGGFMPDDDFSTAGGFLPGGDNDN